MILGTQRGKDVKGGVPLDFVPSSPEDMAMCLSDPLWRLCSGQLYKIMIKPQDENGEEDADAEPLVVPFRPNRAQRRLLKRLHKRNIILKARQLGFTTLICILFLDCALFSHKDRPIRAGIVAHEEDAAKAIFRDKVKFAYENLPAALRAAMPLKRDSADELLFAHNNCSIRVATSLRSGTLHYLHVSEFGKICAKRPDRADEVITGTIPAAASGMIFIESTAEGREGHFFKMCQRARRLASLPRRLTNKEYHFNFFPWWDDMHYRMDPDDVEISAIEHQYFNEVEEKMATMLDIEQRAWWISTRDNEFSGEDEKMWQEYPSTPDEAFQKSSQGCYYTVQMTRMRKERRITTVPFTPGYPVNTFWDIGNSDGTAIWFHQQVGQQHRFIHFLEGWGEPYSFFVSEMQALGYTWGRHYLPHDGNHERQGENSNLTPKQMLERLGLRNVEIVERVAELQHGIQATRDMLALAWIDAENCKEGIDHIDNYRKKWIASVGAFGDEPVKSDGNSEAADALRQWAQVYGSDAGAGSKRQRVPKRRNKSAMAV
ncbi:terminase [Martelella sp. AD-3]|uniref:terminase n=1 Tax=Martelella sp. AD-3 TaxID=686597 RepID=UPI0004677237|nr:terminase [Martelella sp. AD-3]AMM84124.1 terminase [Martelella sp. AD-3]